LLDHGVQPACFCDNNPSQIGWRHFGIPAISFGQLNQTCRDYSVVFTLCKYASEVRYQLFDQRFPAERIISVLSVVGSICSPVWLYFF
jgi:hypothetical protein